MEEIRSRTNPKIKEASALLRPAERQRTGLILLEGARLCADAAGSGASIERCFYTAGAMEKYPDAVGSVRAAAKEAYPIAETVAERLSDTVGTQGVFCVCRRPAAPRAPDGRGFYVMTERLQDPENLGAIARSAEAFGAAGLLVAGGCDPFSPKALRASMGALLRLPVLRVERAPDEVALLRGLGYAVYAAVLSDRAFDLRTVRRGGPAVCVIGNEGAGVSPETAAACSAQVIIPMGGGAESLNAACAASVILWEFLKDAIPPAGGGAVKDG